jgi:hypothetical protein
MRGGIFNNLFLIYGKNKPNSCHVTICARHGNNNMRGYIFFYYFDNIFLIFSIKKTATLYIVVPVQPVAGNSHQMSLATII